MVASPYLTVHEAAAYCRKSLKAFDAWARRRGLLPDARTGRTRLYKESTLRRVLEQDARPWRRPHDLATASQ
jgi:hypothetical protein